MKNQLYVYVKSYLLMQLSNIGLDGEPYEMSLRCRGMFSSIDRTNDIGSSQGYGVVSRYGVVSHITKNYSIIGVHSVIGIVG